MTLQRSGGRSLPTSRIEPGSVWSKEGTMRLDVGRPLPTRTVVGDANGTQVRLPAPVLVQPAGAAKGGPYSSKPYSQPKATPRTHLQHIAHSAGNCIIFGLKLRPIE